jgi:hypothetical protein
MGDVSTAADLRLAEVFWHSLTADALHRFLPPS